MRVVVTLINLPARGIIFIYFPYLFLYFLLKKVFNYIPIIFRASSFVLLVYKDLPEFVLFTLIKLSITNTSR